MANANKIAHLPSRGFIRLAGPEGFDLLQNLVTNDISPIREGGLVYAALLTPQGKLLFDFFLFETDGAIIMDGLAEHLSALLKRLKLYKMRADVEITDASDQWSVWAGFEASEAPAGEQLTFPDPRLGRLGWRRYGPPEGNGTAANADEQAYDSWRLELGVPDVARDAGQDATFLLEANFEELNGVDFQKGCYIGQELASRMKRRNGLRKRLLPVTCGGTMPPPGTPILAGDRNMGDLRSGTGGRALALLRLDRLKEETGTLLMAGHVEVSVDWPDWIPHE